MNRRWRNLTTALRRRRSDPPWVGLAVPPPSAAPPLERQAGSRRMYQPRRGAFQARVLVAAPANVLPPLAFVDQAGSRTRWAPGKRRGFLVVPSGIAVPSTWNRQHAQRPAVRRRSRFFAFTPAVQLATTAPLIPSLTRQTRRTQISARRGEFWASPWPQQATQMPSLVPWQARRSTSRPALPRRGDIQFTISVLPSAVPGFVPRQPRRRPASPASTRRGEFQLIVPTATAAIAPPVAPKILRQASCRMMTIRRGSFTQFPKVVASSVGFICQDLSGSVVIDAYGGTLTLEAYGGTAIVVTYAGSASIDAYGGAASNCGR